MFICISFFLFSPCVLMCGSVKRPASSISVLIVLGLCLHVLACYRRRSIIVPVAQIDPDTPDHLDFARVPTEVAAVEARVFIPDHLVIRIGAFRGECDA